MYIYISYFGIAVSQRSMKFELQSTLLLLLCRLLSTGFEANALSYDYTANIECLANPLKPQYGGGIITNPELENGIKGWSTFGEAKIQHRGSQQGNKFIVAHSRHQPNDSISQKLYLHKNNLYTFSAWIQVNSGINIPIGAVFKTSNGFKHAGATISQSNCWSMLKGGLTVDVSGPAHLYFESKNTTVEIWVDSVSLQPFTQKQWKSHQDGSIEKVGKRNVRIQAVDAKGNPVSNATISVKQKRPGFPFGCSINNNILTNTAYQNWLTSRPFTVTTFENEMKWYSTETSQGKEDYSVSDAMLKFAQQHNIAVRGHNVFWDDPRHQPSWITWLPRKQLTLASAKRLYSIMPKYRGQVIAWDVVNENLHFSYFEDRVLRSASEIFYNWAYRADRDTTLFMNEYNTIEDPEDLESSPAKYLQKLKEIQNFPGNNGIMMGIGLEGHFSTPNLPYIRAAIDTLAAAKLPIWITELDVKSSPNQAMYLEQILREIRSHPDVKGIVMWSAWRPEGCFRMCLTDNNFINLKTGDVVDKLLREWGWGAFTTGRTDAEGFFETSLFHGDYHVEITPQSVNNYSLFDHFLKNVSPITTTTTTTTMSQETSTLPLLLQVES